QPVAGTWHHRFADVAGDIAHDDRLYRAERLLPADGQHGHGEPRALKDSVVLGVLRERAEVREPGPHRARLRVLSRVEVACGLVWLAWIAREGIPDAIQIDALAPSHQTLGVGTPKREVPQRRGAHDVVPGGDARERRIHDHEPLDLVRVTRRVRIRDHDADVV